MVKPYTTLLSEITTYINDNASADITPAEVRQRFMDLLEYFVTYQGAYRVYSLDRNVNFMNYIENGTDVTSIFNDLCATAIAQGYNAIHIPKPLSTQYINFSGQLLIPAYLSVLRDRRAILNYTGSADEEHVIVGAAGTQNSEVEIDLYVRRNTFTNWTQTVDTGILVHQCYRSKIFLNSDGFYQGAELRSNSNLGFAYSLVRPGLIRESRYKLILNKKDANSWINEIVFDCSEGTFSMQSTSRATIGWTSGKYPVGVLYKGHASNNQYTNAHLWIKPCFEQGASGPAWEEVANFEFDTWAKDITVIGARNEQSNAIRPMIRRKPGAVNFNGIAVDMSYMYNSGDSYPELYLDESYANDFQGIEFTSRSGPLRMAARRKSIALPDVAANATQYKSTGTIHIPGWHWRQASGGAVSRGSVGTTHLITRTAVEVFGGITEAPGFLIDVMKCRCFSCVPLLESGAANYRQFFIPWDAALTNRYTSAILTAPAPVSGAIPNTVTISHAGYAYASAPTLTVTGGGGTGCTATCTINGSGQINTVTITNGGSGYVSTPTITITHNHWIKGAQFFPITNYGGAYYYTTGSESPFTVLVNPSANIRYIEMLANPQTSNIKLIGYNINSLDGNPIAIRSWYEDHDWATKRTFDAPTNPWKGNLKDGSILEYDNVTIPGDPWAYRKRGVVFDALNP
jgi:hypothetical protein